ncbi:MAG: toll/interleukin-1 receptor domain-containing protein [Paracoccaceae bacterium]
MKVFLAHASSDVRESDGIAVGLRQNGHKVFFADDDLPAGGNYDERIKRAIEDSDLFLFAVSPDSVADGRFTRSELRFAREKWPDPTGRILPVMVKPTPMAAIPPYLARVTVLKPEGDLVTEVLSEVARIHKTHRNRRLLPVAASIIVMAAAMAVYFWWTSEEVLSVTLPEAVLVERSIFNRGDQFLIKATFRNGGSATEDVSATSLKLSNADVRVDTSSWPPEPISLGPNEAVTSWLYTRFTDSDNTPISGQLPETNWQLCYAWGGSESCTKTQPWTVAPDNSKPQFVAAPETLRTSATAVVARGSEFFIAATRPGRIVRLRDNETGGEEQSIVGDPVDIAFGWFKASPDKPFTAALFVAVRAPDSIEVFDALSLDSLARFPIDLTQAKAVSGLPKLSTQPRDLAIDASGSIWLLTGGGTGEPGLARRSPDGRWEIPPYFEELAFNASEMRLRMSNGRIWATLTRTTPSSLFLLENNQLSAFDGHSFDVVSCAKDIVAGAADGIVLRDCDGNLVEVADTQQKLSFVADFGKTPRQLIEDYGGPEFWIVELLKHPVSSMIVGAYTIYETGGGPAAPILSLLAASPENSATRELLLVDDAEVVDMATTANRALVLMKDRTGNRDAIFVPWTEQP